MTKYYTNTNANQAQTMKMRSAMAASILLFFLAGLPAAHGDTIRFSSDDGETNTTGEPARPWECCDNVEMSPLQIFPPLYRCTDQVKQCAGGCQECEKVVAPGDDDLPDVLYICNDWYSTTDPGPFCTPRPWGDCCDIAICTRPYIPTCFCADEVESCAAACKECEMVESSEPPRYVCQDQFKGQPGPRCTPEPDTENY